MRFFATFLAAVAIMATVTVAKKDKDRIVWHERPVKEQHGCVQTCKNSRDHPSEFTRTQCAVCVDRIRNTVCRDCAMAFHDGLTDDQKNFICERCRHISDFDSSSDWDSGTDSEGYMWGGPWKN
jgi:hypothetical protein